MAFRSVSMMIPALFLAGCASMHIPDEGSPDAQVFATRCSGCHATPHPGRHTLAEWLQLLPLMEQRMSERGMPVLAGEERRALITYLQQHAR